MPDDEPRAGTEVQKCDEVAQLMSPLPMMRKENTIELDLPSQSLVQLK